MALFDNGLKKKLNPLGQVIDTEGQEANKNANAFKGLPKAQSAQVANAPYDWKTAPSPFTKENAPNITGALSGGGITSEMKAPVAYTPQKPQEPQTSVASMAGRNNISKKSASIPKQDTSMIPVVNAGESLNTDLAQSAISDIHAGMPIEEFDKIYPELAQNKGIFQQYALDVQAGMPQEEGAKMYPELFGQAPTPPTSQAPTEAPKEEAGVLDYFKGLAGRVGEGIAQVPSDIINVGAEAVGSDFRAQPLSQSVFGVTPSTEKGIIGRSADIIKKSGKGLADIYESSDKQTGAETITQGTAKTVHGVVNVLGEVFMSGLSTVTPDVAKEKLASYIKDIANTEGGQSAIATAKQIKQDYTEYAKNNPRAARNLTAITELADTALQLYGVGKAKQAIEKGISKTVGTVETTIPKKGGLVTKTESFLEKATTPKSVRIDIDTGKILPPLKPVTNVVKNVEKSNDLISRGLKPTIVGKDTGAKIEVFQDKIRQGIESIAKTQGNADDGIDALTKAGNRKKEIFSTIEKNNDFVSKLTPDTEVASKIKAYMETPEYNLLENTNPGLTKKLEEYIKVYTKGKQFSQDDLQVLKTNQNKKIPASSWAEMLTTDKDALLADSTIAKILGDTIDDNVEAVLGKTNKALNREYGAVREVEKNLARRMGVFQRNTKGGLAGLTDIFSLPEIVIGGLTGDVKKVATGLLQKTVSTIIRDKENPNRIIKELFKLHGKKEGKLQKALGLQDQSLNIKLGENANIPTSSNGITPIVRSVRDKGTVQAIGGNTVGVTKKISIAEEKAKAGMKKKFPVDLKAEKAKSNLTTNAKQPLIKKSTTPEVQGTSSKPTTKTTPNKEIIGLTEKGGVKNITPGNQVKYNQGVGYEPVRLVLNDKDAQIARWGALSNKGIKTPSASIYLEMKSIETRLRKEGMSISDIQNRAQEIKDIAKKSRSKDESILVDLRNK